MYGGVPRRGSACATASWRPAIERGLAPVTVGLVFASALTITRAADHGAGGVPGHRGRHASLLADAREPARS